MPLAAAMASMDGTPAPDTGSDRVRGADGLLPTAIEHTGAFFATRAVTIRLLIADAQRIETLSDDCTFG